MKKKFAVIAITLFLVIYLIFNLVTSYAGNGISASLEKLDSNGVGYGIGDPNNGGAGNYIWHIKGYDSAGNTRDYNLYCIKANYGDTWNTNPEERVDYNLQYDLQTDRSTLLSYLSGAGKNTLQDLLSTQKGAYKELLWILDNLYIEGYTDKDSYLEKIGIAKDDQGYYNKNTNKGYDFILTDADIKAAQKAAIWHFTNYVLDGDDEFNQEGKTDWITITEDGKKYINLSDITKFVTTEGEDRNEQVGLLYDYLVQQAIANAEKYTAENKYTVAGNVSINTQNVTTRQIGSKYVIGPIKIIKNDDAEYKLTLSEPIIAGNEDGIDINDCIITDENGVSLEDATFDEIAARTDGFYITMEKTTNPKFNFCVNITYETTEKKLWLQGTDETIEEVIDIDTGEVSHRRVINVESEQPIVEVEPSTVIKPIQVSINLPTFDLALRKNITKVNGISVTNTREPNISLDTLQTGTTATYNHRKDPVLVQKGDIVTYKITIYNEGNKNGYATEITDQLPTGLKYTGGSVVTSNKNTYNVTYNETSNNVIFTANTNTALNKYATNSLDSETLEFTCEVTETPDTSNDKILTNIAWISGAYDSETAEIAIDRDSETETKSNANKDNMDDYKGNTNNKVDLTDSNYFYEGEQDDDDFEKLILEPKTSVTVNKEWDDNNDQDGIRPTSIIAVLLADGVEKDEITLDENNNWTHTFTDLPLKNNGTEIVYTVQEKVVPTDYIETQRTNSKNNYTIINTHIPAITEVTVKKEWNDNNNQDGIRPTLIIVELLADGTAINEVTLDENNGWTHTFTDLPLKNNGTEIIYTVQEKVVPTDYTETQRTNSKNNYTIINTHDTGETSITVNKEWNDNNNQDGIRPTSIIAELLADDTQIDEVTLDENNGWTHTFENLPTKSNGIDIIYTVQEKVVPEGYIESQRINSSTNYTIINTHVVEETSVRVNKEWNDEENFDNIRPTSIIVTLLADGVEADEIILDESNNWTYTFENLASKSNGIDIVYTVQEKIVPEGYTADVTTNSSNNYTITNTHKIERILDLALRKYIIKINNNELTDLGLATRVPNISDSSLQTGTTASYRHKKDPVQVETNDIITYAITIYNEGEKAGYASQIIDQLPTGLIYNPSSTIISKDPTGADKNTYTVTYDTTTNKVTFDIVNTTENPAQELQPYGTSLDYETLEIKCKVIYTAKAGENNILTNVAWISGAYDTEENKVAIDRDSQPETKPNVNKDNMEDYKGNSGNKTDLTDSNYFYEGEQDDDDFEKLYVKTFDLSLRKFVSQVNDEKLDREPEVDVTPLVNKTDTTAIYNHSKKTVSLKVGDTVIYTIRVYNEGEIAGFASEVKDYLPPYLEYVENSTINNKYGWSISEDRRVATTTYLSTKEISAFNGTTLDYEDIQIECIISDQAIPEQSITNIAEISEYKYGDTVVPEDIDSSSDNIDEDLPEDKDLPDYKKEEQDKTYVPGNEDDDDFEKVYVKEFDLALRKFITEIQGKEVTSRVPEVKYENGQIRYEHSKDAITVHVGDTVIYTIRIYNEGEIDGYASEITDDIPEYLEYLPEESTNVDYMWKMYDENGDETQKVEEAVKVKTEYLSKDNSTNNLIQAFDGNMLYYKDIKIAFKVKDPNSNTIIITNHAQISDDTDENGNPIKDKDSETDKWNEGEDDQDIENVKVEYFDLSLLKFVSKVIVKEGETEKITETGYNGHEEPEPVVKVELHRKKLNQVTVKFGYGITITNEGDIPGYATEITDYVPEGLKFEVSDNPNWIDEGNNVISTKQLENTLLQPGESKTIEVTLTWINGNDNLALKTNTAEISEDNNEYDVPDRDSTPDNKKEGEDDIDIAKVILSIATGSAKTYFTLTLGLLTVILVGIILIKRFVI